MVDEGSIQVYPRLVGSFFFGRAGETMLKDACLRNIAQQVQDALIKHLLVHDHN